MNWMPDIAIPPGETIAETVEYLGMPLELAIKQLGLTKDQYDKLIVGDLRIDDKLSRRLGNLCSSPTFWKRLDENYVETLRRLQCTCIGPKQACNNCPPNPPN